MIDFLNSLPFLIDHYDSSLPAQSKNNIAFDTLTAISVQKINNILWESDGVDNENKCLDVLTDIFKSNDMFCNITKHDAMEFVLSAENEKDVNHRKLPHGDCMYSYDFSKNANSIIEQIKTDNDEYVRLNSGVEDPNKWLKTTHTQEVKIVGNKLTMEKKESECIHGLIVKFNNLFSLCTSVNVLDAIMAIAIKRLIEDIFHKEDIKLKMQLNKNRGSYDTIGFILSATDQQKLKKYNSTAFTYEEFNTLVDHTFFRGFALKNIAKRMCYEEQMCAINNDIEHQKVENKIKQYNEEINNGNFDVFDALKEENTKKENIETQIKTQVKDNFGFDSIPEKEESKKCKTYLYYAMYLYYKGYSSLGAYCILYGLESVLHNYIKKPLFNLNAYLETQLTELLGEVFKSILIDGTTRSISGVTDYTIINQLWYGGKCYSVKILYEKQFNVLSKCTLHKKDGTGNIDANKGDMLTIRLDIDGFPVMVRLKQENSLTEVEVSLEKKEFNQMNGSVITYKPRSEKNIYIDVETRMEINIQDGDRSERKDVYENTVTTDNDFYRGTDHISEYADGFIKMAVEGGHLATVVRLRWNKTNPFHVSYWCDSLYVDNFIATNSYNTTAIIPISFGEININNGIIYKGAPTPPKRIGIHRLAFEELTECNSYDEYDDFYSQYLHDPEYEEGFVAGGGHNNVIFQIIKILLSLAIIIIIIVLTVTYARRLCKSCVRYPLGYSRR